MAISADLLATTTDNTTIELWDIEWGVNRGKLGDGRTVFNWFGFSPDGKRFSLWEGNLSGQWAIVPILERGNRCLEKTVNMPWTLTTAAIAPAPNSAYDLAAADTRGGILLWKWSNDARISLPAQKSSVIKLAFSADGKWLAAAYSSGIRVWDLETQEILADHGGIGAKRSGLHAGQANLVCLGKRQKTAVPARCGNGLVQCHAQAEEQAAWEPIRIFWNGLVQWELQDDPRRALGDSPVGNILVTGGGSGVLEFWGVGTKPAGFDPKDWSQQPPPENRPRPCTG